MAELRAALEAALADRWNMWGEDGPGGDARPLARALAEDKRVAAAAFDVERLADAMRDAGVPWVAAAPSDYRRLADAIADAYRDAK